MPISWVLLNSAQLWNVPQIQCPKNQRIIFAAPQKLDEIPDNKLTGYMQPWPSKARGPLPIFAHPCFGDIFLRLLEVKVVRHRTNWHKLRDKGFDVLELWGRSAEQELVACLPDPFSQNPDSLRRFRCVPKVEHGDGPELWQKGVQNRVEDTNPVPICTRSGSGVIEQGL